MDEEIPVSPSHLALAEGNLEGVCFKRLSENGKLEIIWGKS